MPDEPRMADAYGVPEFFATHYNLEDAGGNCARIYGCTERGRLLIPHYSVVVPAQFLISSSQRVLEFSRKMLVGAGLAH
jgi:peroxiredoxin